MYDIEQLRLTEFPLTQEHIYFNNAAIAPLPMRGKTRVQQAADGLSRQPIRFFREKGMATIEQVKEGLVQLLNAQSTEEIAISTSCSTAINQLAQAITWQTGENLIFCDLEFPSNVYPWLSLARDGVEIRQAPAQNGGLTLANLTPLVDEQTRLVAVSAVQFFSGHRTDLAQIGAFCRERGILFVVDAIQSIGHMEIDVQAMNIDALASGGQKSIMALPGVGLLYVRQAVAEAMQPRIVGGNATVNFLHWLDYDMTFGPGAQRFSLGTPNVPGIFSLAASLELLQELGIENIDRHTTGLSTYAIGKLREAGFAVITPDEAHGPIVTFKLEMADEEADALLTQLAERHISVAKHLDATGRPYLRASFHCYNTQTEIDKFTAVLQELLS